jgi:hypothetical protein
MRQSLPETIDLGNGHTAEMKTELTGTIERDYYSFRDKLLRGNGTGKPARTEPDPDNGANLRVVPAIPPEQTIDDNFALLDWVAGQLLMSSTMEGIVPWKPYVAATETEPAKPGTRDLIDIDVVHAIDDAVGKQQRRIVGLGPKTKRTSGTSPTTSGSDAPAPLPEQTPEP